MWSHYQAPCRTKHLDTNENEQTLQCTETKRGRQKRGHGDEEGEHSEDDYEGNDEPADSRSSSFPTSPQRKEQYTMCFVFHTKTQISAGHTILMLKIRVCILLLSFFGVDTGQKCVCRCVCLKLFDHSDLKPLSSPLNSVRPSLRQQLVWWPSFGQQRFSQHCLRSIDRIFSPQSPALYRSESTASHLRATRNE